MNNIESMWKRSIVEWTNELWKIHSPQIHYHFTTKFFCSNDSGIENKVVQSFRNSTPCQFKFYCWRIFVTKIILHCTMCWMFVIFFFFVLLFLGHLEGGHRFQTACYSSEFIWDKCGVQWCWMFVSWIFLSLCLGHLEGD
jgi:hypothetical protein